MFPWPDEPVRRPRFKNKVNKFDQTQQEILNTWQSGRSHTVKKNQN